MKLINSFKHYLSNMAFMFRYSWEIAKSGYFILILKSILSTVQPFVLLLIPKYILDELAGGRRWNIALFYVLLFIAVLAFFTITGIILGYLEKIVVNKIQMKNTLVYEKLWLNIDYGKLENGSFRDWGANIQNNINAWSFINDTVMGFLINFFQLIGYTYIIASLHPVMIGVILAVIILSSLLSKKVAKINFEYQPIIAKFSRRFNYLFSTMVSFDYGKDIRINEASDWLESRYEKETNEYIQKYEENQRKNFAVEVLGAVIGFVQTILVYGYCAYKAIIGSITIGSFTVFLGAITAFTSSFSGFIGKCMQMKYFSRFVDDYKKFAEDAKPSNIDNETVDVCSLKPDNHEIEFVDVSFKYPNTDNFVLKDINIVIRAGERLSVVGYNGAGKSTFIKLICRLYEPSKGKILYNGVDISTIHKEQYRELISVVFQDFRIFSMSFRENIVLNRVEDEAGIHEAIEKSGLAYKVATLSKGIETQIGREFDREGLEFSGGEGQKLDCARAYYKDAPVVILDEPTSALDPIAESHLYERFNSIIGKKTAIYISHRLASVKFCDTVVVFAGGEIVEYGTHHLLLEQGGVYADMFKKQAEYYIREEEAEACETY